MEAKLIEVRTVLEQLEAERKDLQLRLETNRALASERLKAFDRVQAELQQERERGAARKARLEKVAMWLEHHAQNIRNANGDGDILAGNLDEHADEIREALKDD